MGLRMSCLPVRLAVASAAASLLFFRGARSARAEETTYAKEPVTTPQYTAPLYQTTQPSYVPQSVALSGPREIKDWSEGDSIPPGYRPVERTRKGLVVGGAVTFGTMYLISAMVAAAGDDASKYNTSGKNELAALYIPAFGPFIQMANTESSSGKFLLAVDGIAQTAGAAMFIIGLTSPKTVLVRNDLAEVRVTPVVTASTAGAGLTGTF